MAVWANSRAIKRLACAGLFLFLAASSPAPAADVSNDDCLACHGDKTFTTTKAGKTVSRFVDAKRFKSSVHGSLSCTNCHADLEGKDLPHNAPSRRVQCGTCHSDEYKQHSNSLHGKAIARGDTLAPHCVDCHGNHDILPVKDKNSAVAPLKVPFVCGRCHQEGTPVQRTATSTSTTFWKTIPRASTAKRSSRRV